MPANPLGEVFGYPVSNNSERAKRYREDRLCPFNNIVPNCTKDKAKDPLGVCCVNTGAGSVITCPVRFREDWIIAHDAASFFFDKGVKWTSLGEVRLNEGNGRSAGNIDYVLVSYDEKGTILNFASLEVQAVYISGNLRNPFESYMNNPTTNFLWEGANFPKPDYLSSSRKRLVPQMLFKGGIFNAWGKKQAVALQKSFYETLPKMPTVDQSEAEIAWMLYDLVLNDDSKKLELKLIETKYTDFNSALIHVTSPVPGDINLFMVDLQKRLDNKLSNKPDAPILGSIITNE